MKQTAIARGIQSVRAETDVSALIGSLNKAFADFKAENDRQLNDIKKGSADALQALKVENINADIANLQRAVDDANSRMAAAELNGGASAGLKDKEYSAAFSAHFKKGDVQAALNKGTASDGGYLAPVEWDRSITDRLIEVSPLRQLCFVQTIGNAGFSKLFAHRGATSGWVGEAEERPETGTPTLSSLAYETGELYANPAATQQMLDDSEINLEVWLAGEVETEFAYQEGIAFLTGSGDKKPRGLLTYITGGVNANKHPYGDIKTIKSNAAATITADSLIDLTESLPTALTAGASMIANKSTITAARKLKDGQGNYLWQPSFTAGKPATINGYGITEVAGMPAIAANSIPIMFGDFKRGYMIIDRMGVRVLRDPFTKKPFVSFYTTKRVGGGLLNPDYLKALKISA
ncbi:phage major capsid protein [Solimicrobium silvestre]|uniref:Phage major capsid protein, HK97 family n=1 Tax=Solimicrobium silvestre TaxID=2099400 RepID=A0A2S9GZC6_9BURK|nr:phage major capsid protein [Solimicrobium silvestre]PRC93081.1 Phage major capsid protein, HK97 family [Solimicrobium silvestre]